MDVLAFKDQLIAGITSDQDLDNWVTDTYGSSVKVFVGEDERKPPCGSNDTPYVTVILPGSKTGPGVPHKLYRIVLVCVINDSETANHSSDLITEYAGINRLETFRQFVFETVKTSLPVNTQITEIETENEAIEAFPIMASAMVIEIKEDHLMGRDPFQ